MIAVIPSARTTESHRLQDRQDALCDVLTYTAGCCELSHDGEQAIRSAAMHLIEPILHLADSATTARLEYEAIDSRLDRHVQTHPGCTIEQPCSHFRVLKIRRSRLLAAWDRAYQNLVRGRR